MNVMLDILGAVIIGGMLLMMMITFQYSLREAADRAMYIKEMLDHMDMAAKRLNAVVALAGIGFTPTDTVNYATADSLVFKTYWDYQNDTLGASPNTISIRLANMPSPWGKALIIRQNGVPLNDMGQIFWVENIKFLYHNKNNALTTNIKDVRDAELHLSFFRNPPRADGKVLRNKLEIKCFFMNAYMRGA